MSDFMQVGKRYIRQRRRWQWLIFRLVIVGVVLGVSAIGFTPRMTDTAFAGPIGSTEVSLSISPVFAPGVQYWKDDIVRWAKVYDLDPNLLATVMQLESCGDPRAESPTGALGLFQVMDYYFDPKDEPFDPDINASHGLAILKEDLELAGDDVGMALASYNGGPALMAQAWQAWPTETQLYYQWGLQLYQAATSAPGTVAAPDYSTNTLCQQAQVSLWFRSQGLPD